MASNRFTRFVSRHAAKQLRKTPARFQLDLLVLEDRSNPAQLWVASPAAMTILNDIGPAGFSPGDTVRVALPGGQFTNATFGSTAFSSVDLAVQAANGNADSSNTIRLLDGTYTLNSQQLGVTKNLSLVGSGQGTTTLHAGVNTTTGGSSPNADGAAAILVNRGVSLNVSSLTLDGRSGTVDVPVLLKYTDTGSAPTATSVLSDVKVQNVGTTGGTAGTAGVGVFVGNGAVTVTDSQFTNIGTHAVLYRGPGATGSVLGSTFTGQGAGTRLNVAVGADDLANVTIRGNTISNFLGSAGATDSAGVLVEGSLFHSPTVDVENNQFSNNRLGVRLGSLSLDVTGTKVLNNNFLGQTVAGVSSLTSGILNNLSNFYQGNLANVVGLLLPGNTLGAAASVGSTAPAGQATPLASVALTSGTLSGHVTNTTTGTGAAGVTVFLDANQNGTLDQTEVAVTTNASGNYTFSGLPILNSPTLTSLRVRVATPSGGTAGSTPFIDVNLSPLQSAGSATDTNVTLPPAGTGGTGTGGTGTGGTGTGGVGGTGTGGVGGGIGGGTGTGGTGSTPAAGVPQGPGRPTDGSTLRFTAAAAGHGSDPQVVVYNPDGSVRLSFLAFDEGFQGGVRVATGDINRDGVDDIIVGAGAGAGPQVKVFDGATGELLRSFMAFDEGFKGGVSVASADINRDGFDDIVVGAASGSSPHVKVFDGTTGAETASFLAFDAGFKNGVTVSYGDVNGDGYDDIVVGAAPGAGPHVKVFSGRDFSVLYSFFAFDKAFAGGVTVAAGDVNGDGKDDIIVGAGAGGDPRVSVFDGGTGKLVRSFLAYDPGFRGGVDVGYGANADGTGSIITGAGAGGKTHIKYFAGDTGALEDSYFAWEESGMSGINVS